MTNKGNKFTAWVFLMWRPILAFIIVALIVGSIFGFQLGSLTRGVSASEQTYISSLDSGSKIISNPVNIVHKLPTYALQKLNYKNITAYRAISALYATLAVISCFFILKEWHTDRVAILGTWLFMTSAWILHVGRMATAESSFLLMMPLLWVTVWLYNTTLRKSALLLLSLAVALTIYVPGFIWLVLTASIWKRKHLWAELKQVKWWFRLGCAVVILLILAPLVYASIASPKLLLEVAGLPASLPNIRDIAQNIINIPSYLFVYGPNNPSAWLGRLPLLDVFSSVIFIIGIYSQRYHLKQNKIQLIVGSTILLCALISLGGSVTVTALMPAVYIFIAAGIAFMLQQWFTVFPYNPIARTIATTLMSITVLVVSYYHISHYFIAWPGTPATRQAFSQSLLK